LGSESLAWSDSSGEGGVDEHLKDGVGTVAPSKKGCVSPSIAQSVAVKLLSGIASFTGKRVDYGVGESIGAGKGNFGFNFSASQ
jgi:hypothetical protein